MDWPKLSHTGILNIVKEQFELFKKLYLDVTKCENHIAQDHDVMVMNGKKLEITASDDKEDSIVMLDTGNGLTETSSKNISEKGFEKAEPKLDEKWSCGTTCDTKKKESLKVQGKLTELVMESSFEDSLHGTGKLSKFVRKLDAPPGVRSWTPPNSCKSIIRKDMDKSVEAAVNSSLISLAPRKDKLCKFSRQLDGPPAVSSVY